MSNMTWIGYGHVRHGRDVNGRGGHKDKCKDKDKDRSSFRKMCAIDILYSLSFQDGPDQFNITHL